MVIAVVTFGGGEKHFSHIKKFLQNLYWEAKEKKRIIMIIR